MLVYGWTKDEDDLVRARRSEQTIERRRDDETKKD